MGILKRPVRLQTSRLLTLGGLLFLSHPVAHAKPAVEFDVRRAVECRDMTSTDFAHQHPNERLVECAFTVSVNLVSGNIEEVDAIRVEINNCDNSMTVRNFSPATRLESEYGGDIQTTRTHESSRTLAASLGGEIPNAFGGVVAKLTPTINGGGSGKEVITETTKRAAPKRVVIASGTMSDEHGVFFTLRSSPLSSLEGLHEFKVQFIIPSEWRGGSVQVVCRATGEQKRLWMKRQQVWAEKSTTAALTLSSALPKTTQSAGIVH
jgi:hypothetical protein